MTRKHVRLSSQNMRPMWASIIKQTEQKPGSKTYSKIVWTLTNKNPIISFFYLKALYNHGPLSVAFFASENFQFYKSGMICFIIYASRLFVLEYNRLSIKRCFSWFRMSNSLSRRPKIADTWRRSWGESCIVARWIWHRSGLWRVLACEKLLWNWLGREWIRSNR